MLAFVAQPAAASPDYKAVEQKLASMAAENPGEYGIAAVDLATGTMISFNGNEPFPMASTMKVAVAATYLSQVDAGQRSLDTLIAGVSARTLMDQMITRSDNRATDLLIAELGGPQVIDNWMRSHGLSGIRVDRTIAQLLSARRDLRDVRDSSTPTAMLSLLRTVDGPRALTPASRSLLLDMMSRCHTGRNRMRALLPAGTRVEHKTGTLNGYTGDVGFVTLPDGRRIAVALFARGGVNRPAVIATAARTIYDAFGAEASQARFAVKATAPATGFATGLSPATTPAAAFATARSPMKAPASAFTPARPPVNAPASNFAAARSLMKAPASASAPTQPRVAAPVSAFTAARSPMKAPASTFAPAQPSVTAPASAFTGVQSSAPAMTTRCAAPDLRTRTLAEIVRDATEPASTQPAQTCLPGAITQGNRAPAL
ncbi:hypothetical protein C7I55_20255 [Sphingomonas deserti]|uniref:Beta-lactamase n=2 Tax=Allosphingosinicella deserti TaxID=2116704 RepID=A0A2P7QJJ8_9SPHN|nr:hypothetical protein C7I55_20255 [Sphingomonas deserti]